ncbi:MAG: ImmA/IrrE family metallo-endopeptidase [Myxococcales bacterium]|nr:ImmA/IrrE family metallo-endopeptidase [Myxococcales bacterium]
MTPLPLRRARAAADRLTRQIRIRSPEDIVLEDIAWMFGARVERGDLPGAHARLARIGDRAVIRVSTRVADPGAERFSIAHELGHLVLAHATPAAADAVCGPTPPGAVTHEAEANAFASELLMPEPLVRRSCEVSPVSLQVARDLAQDYQVSLLAAALRFVELTSERCALVLARKRRVEWVARSANFGPYIPTGMPLDQASVAIDFFTKGRLFAGCQPVPADSWFEEDDAGDVEIMEDTAVVPGADAVMALLWIPERAARRLERG